MKHFQEANELFNENRTRHQLNEHVFLIIAKGTPDAGQTQQQKNEDRRYLHVWYDQIYLDKVNCWDHYYRNRFRCNIMLRAPNIFQCSCYQAMKKSVCKHAIFTMVQTKDLPLPPDFYPATIEQRRKRGRPRKVPPALVMD